MQSSLATMVVDRLSNRNNLQKYKFDKNQTTPIFSFLLVNVIECFSLNHFTLKVPKKFILAPVYFINISISYNFVRSK